LHRISLLSVVIVTLPYVDCNVSMSSQGVAYSGNFAFFPFKSRVEKWTAAPSPDWNCQWGPSRAVKPAPCPSIDASQKETITHRPTVHFKCYHRNWQKSRLSKY